MRELEVFRKRVARELFSEQRSFKIEIAFGDGSESDEVVFTPIRPGASWGANYRTCLFRFTGVIPEAWCGKEVYARINLGGEGTVFDRNFRVIDSVSDVSVFDINFKRELLPIAAEAEGGEEVVFYIEATANGMFGLWMDSDPAEDSASPNGAFVAEVNQGFFGILERDIWDLVNDLSVASGFLGVAGEKSRERRIVENAVNLAIAAYRNDPKNAAQARKELAPILKWRAKSSALTACCVGHAHLDTAWLWPIEQSVKKCARTFATQMGLIDRYPEYVFGASAACHYEFVKDCYPELYERIKKYVAQGRLELQGGMYVEADCNITGGESLIRQFLYGKHFFIDEFGVEVKNLWLPDAFGYSANLPQIMKSCGCDYFLTQKISWNELNKFPYHSFYWRGIDGSRVLAHFPPEDGYNSQMSVESLAFGQDNYAQGAENGEFLSLFGIGDGGSGPTADYIERGLRLKSFEGAPKVKFGRADEFFARLDKKKGYPEWSGELYLELHRGTLTTQAQNKYQNRRFEQKMRELETAFSALGAQEYPREVFDAMWRSILINQFHDILPGSSINAVYEETKEDYAALETLAAKLEENLAAALSDGDENAVSYINTLGVAGSVIVKLPEKWRAATVNGEAVPVQNGSALIDVPALGAVTLRKSAKKAAEITKKRDLTLENSRILYKFNRFGEIVTIFDKELRREFMPNSGRGNVFTLHVDYPTRWEAWDVERSYMDAPAEELRACAVGEVERGVVCSRLKIEFKFGNSSIKQNVILREGAKLLAFETEVEWRESRKMLRVGFEHNVCAEEAKYDLDYGCISRPLHTNTSWEQAKFEKMHHRFFDVSERDCGLALLNDSKYGCSVRRGFFDLNLLRSTKYPDFYADQGEHKFTYALLPHDGDLVASDVELEAALLNRAPLMMSGKIAEFALPVQLEYAENAQLVVLKRAHKGENHVIRVVETGGVGGNIVLAVNGCTLLEEVNSIELAPKGTLPVRKGRVKIALKPFEIKTYILK